jgi:hypothetical protein
LFWILVLWKSFWKTVFLGWRLSSFESSLFIFSIVLRLHLFNCRFGSFCVRVLRASTRMSLSMGGW